METPSGVIDLLPKDAQYNKQQHDAIHAFFIKHHYELIKTPTIDRVLLFKHASNRGTYKKYPGLTNISGLFENEYDYNNRLIENDTMSGFYMPKNFKITLYENIFSGIQYSNSNNIEDVVVDYIGDNLNDKVTSVKIEKLDTYNPYEIFNLELLGVAESILYEP